MSRAPRRPDATLRPAPPLPPLLILATALALTGCGGGKPSWSAARADAGRTGALGAPGPVVQPVVSWRHAPLENPVVLPPVIADGRVFVADGTLVLALSLADGAVLWEARVPEWATSAPAVAGSAVMVAASDMVWCFDAATGKKRWTHQADFAVGSAPVVAAGLVLFEATSLAPVDAPESYLEAVRVASGKQAWKASYTKGLGYGPAVAGDVVVAVSGSGIRGFSLRDGAEIWSVPHARTDFESPVLAGAGVVFMRRIANASTFVALDPATGKEAWQETYYNADYSSPAPAAAAGLVFVPITGRGLVALDASTGEEAWRSRTEGLVETAPAVGGDLAYWAEGDLLRANRVSDGALAWELRLEGPVEHLALAEGVLVASLFSRAVVALR